MRTLLILTGFLSILTVSNPSQAAFSTCKIPVLSEKLFQQNKINPQELKGKLLVGRKAVFTVSSEEGTLVQSEQSFSSMSGEVPNPEITCDNLKNSKFNFSMVGPTLLDWRFTAESRPAIWQFSAVNSTTGVYAQNNISRVLSSETTPDSFFKELQSRAEVYKVSSYQYALRIYEFENGRKKTLTLLYDVVN